MSTEPLNELEQSFDDARISIGDTARAQKVNAIAQLMVESLKDLYQLQLAQLMPRRKSAFRQIRRRDRSPKKQIMTNRAIALYQFRSAQRVMQMFMILSQPIEKYKPGAHGGPAIVGESGPEIIVVP